MAKSLDEFISSHLGAMDPAIAESEYVQRLAQKLAQANTLNASLSKINDALRGRVESLEDVIELYAGAGELDKLKPMVSEANAKGKHLATAIVAWSDWHVAEVVSKRAVGNLNEYNPDIARQRAEALAQRTIKLFRHNADHYDFASLVVFLGGDFITGYLHEELSQTNAMAPVEELYFAIQLLERCINSLVSAARDISPTVAIRIVAHRGNHGRTTRRMQFKNDYQTSYESLLYWVLRDRIPDVEWAIPETDVYLTQLDATTTIRTMHGHQIKYAGGVGGIAIPLRKFIYRQDDTERAARTYLGHWHTYEPSDVYSICGSLKGYDEYSRSHGFAFRPPSQLFEIYSHKYQAFTSHTPIFVS